MQSSLAGCIARAELRPRTVALAMLGYGVAGFAIGLANHRAGAYPILTGSVTNLDYLAGALIAAAALMTVRATEFGVDRELFLAGITPRRRAIGSALVAAGVAVAIWAGGNAVTVLLLVPALAGRDTSFTLVSSSSGPAGAIVAGLGLVVCYALMGTALGTRSRTRAAVITVVGTVAVIPLILVLFGAFPPALWLRSLCPTAFGHGLIESYDDVRGAALLRWGVPLVYLAAATWLVATARAPWLRGVRRDAAGAPTESTGDPGDDRVTRWRAVWSSAAVPAGALIAAGAVFGYVVPARTAAVIPWWLHGDWLADEARGTASGPVAGAYMEAVVARRPAAERRLSLAGTSGLDPTVRSKIRRAGKVRSVRYDYDEAVPAGTVIVSLGSHGRAIDMTVCVRRTRAGWRVRKVSASGLC
jgi:hypothetical protein